MIRKLLAKLKGAPEHQGGRERTAIEKKLKHINEKRKSRKLHREIMTGKAPRGRTE
jgi:hypothetical protein